MFQFVDLQREREILVKKYNFFRFILKIVLKNVPFYDHKIPCKTHIKTL